jgi:hypothetical protein
MATKQFTVRMESQGGAQVKSDLAGIGEAGKAAHDKIGQGAKQSSQSTEKMTQEQARAMRAFQSLKASVDPAYAAHLKYEKAVQQVQRATALGIASKEEESRVLAQLRSQHDQTVAAMQRSATETAALGRATSASSMQVANLGAQFNDIGVMLAAGQSPLQLAVQQGTQINQVFAQMGGGRAALRGVAAGLSSMVSPLSLVTIGLIAGGAALFQWGREALAARNDAGDLEQAVEDLNAAVSDVSSYNQTARQSLAELKEEFGENAEAVRDNAQALRDLAAVKAIGALEDTVNSLASSVSEAIVQFERLEKRGRRGSNEQIAALAEEVGFTADEARRLRDAFADLSAAEGLDGATDAAQALYAQMVDIFGSAQDIPPELQEAARQALQAANAGYDIEAALNNSADAAGAATTNAAALVGQMSAAASYAAQLAANLSVAPTGIRNFEQQAERLTAQIAALDAGYDGITASAAGYRKELEQKYGLAEAANAAEDAYISALINRQVEEFENVQRLNKEYADKSTAIDKVAKSSGGSASASRAAADAAQSAVEQLQEQIASDRELIGLSEDATAEIEARRRVEDALARDKLTWTEQAIQGLTDQIMLNRQLREESENTARTLGTIFDSFTRNGFSGLGQDLLGLARNSLNNVLDTSFAKGGGGLGNVWESITSGFTGIGARYSAASTAAGGGFGGLISGAGAVLSGLMPGIGTALAVFDLAKGLIGTTTKLTNALEGTLGIGGLLRGTEYDLKQNDSLFGSKVEKNSEEIFGSWARFIAQDLDEEFRGMVQNTRDGIRALGLDINEAFTYDFDVQFDESLPHDQLMERLREELNKANDELLRTSLAAAGLARDGETGAQTLQALNASLGAANASLRLLDQTLFDVSAIGAGAARELVELTGGLDAFTTKTAFVFDNFLTETERDTRALQIATENLNSTFGDLNRSVPETHAEFISLLDAQDLTTAAGRNTYAALLDVAQAFVTVNGAALGAAAATEQVAQAVQQAWSTASSVSAVGEMAQITSSALTDAENALRAAFAAEADRVNEAYDLQIQAAQASADAANAVARAQAAESERLRRERLDVLQAQSDALSDRVSIYRTISDALERAYTDRRVLTAIGQRMQISSAQAFLRSAVASGGTDDVERLEQALEAVENPSTALYGSFQEYQHDFNVNTNLIGELRDLNDDALTVEERSLRALEDQIDAIRSASSQQVQTIQANTSAIEAARDAELGALSTQLNALFGIDSSVLSVEQAIRNLEIAQGASGAAQDAVDQQNGGVPGVVSDFAPGSRLYNAQNVPSSLSGQINSLYNQILGRNVDAAGLDFYHDLVTADNGFGLSDVKSDLAKNASNDTGIPAFALGGTHAGGLRIVGERGPELEYTGPSRIYSNSDTRRMLDNREVVSVLNRLLAIEARMEARLSDIRDDTRRTRQIAEQEYEDAQQ